jgi:hypothetical protein
MAAMAADDSRFEAYAVAVLVKMKQGQPEDAKKFLTEAKKRAPQEKQDKLDQLGKLIDQEASAAQKTPPASSPATIAVSPTVSIEAQRKMDALKLIVADADKAQNDEDRQKCLNEFLEKSEDYVQNEDSNSIPVWTLRGLAAIELSMPQVAWDAGQHVLVLDTIKTIQKCKISLPNSNVEAGLLTPYLMLFPTYAKHGKLGFVRMKTHGNPGGLARSRLLPMILTL